MKKRSALFFGLLAAVLAFSMVLAGCEDPNGSDGDGGGGVAWRSELVSGGGGLWSGVSSLGFANSEYGNSVTTGNGSQWTLYATDDKPAGEASTFTVARYYPGDGTTNNDKRVKVTYTLATGGQSFEITAAVVEGSASTASDANAFPLGTYTLQQ